jgi:hypothetical protein
MAAKTGAREFYEFEKTLHERLMQAEREIVGEVMAASDVDADAIELEGRVHRRVLRSAQTHMTAAGPVEVHVLSQHPELKLAKITDAGGDNGEYTATLPPGPEILDFFHATEHLAAAIAAVHGDGTFATRHKFEFLRERLLHEDRGAEAVINALAHLRRRNPRIKKIGTVLRYFRKNKHRMRYAQWKREGFMIGSGVVEAACKTLVAQRLKLSGMRWGSRGAQAILTMRGWDQSDRFDEAWALVAATYQSEVVILANVIDITPKPEKKPRRRASG